MRKKQMPESFENEYMVIIKEEKLLDCRFAQNLEMDLEIAKKCVGGRIKISNGHSYPAIIDVSGMKSVSKEAREYLSKEGSQLLTAGALLVNSPLSKILGNFFLTLNKPQIPSKLFTNENEARKWLTQFKIV